MRRLRVEVNPRPLVEGHLQDSPGVNRFGTRDRPPFISDGLASALSSLNAAASVFAYEDVEGRLFRCFGKRG
jgi:hypothetical protein